MKYDRRYILAFAALFTICFVFGIRYVTNHKPTCREKAISRQSAGLINDAPTCDESAKLELNSDVWVVCRCPK